MHYRELLAEADPIDFSAFKKKREAKKIPDEVRYRDLIREALQLPSRVERLLRRPIRIALKDGRVGVLTVEPYDHNNQRASLEQATALNLYVEVDGVIVGSMSISPNRFPEPDDDFDLNASVRGTWSVSNLYVADGTRRQGIATAMYDTLARAGMKILASGGGRGGKLLPDGASLWDTRRTMKRGRLVYPYPMIWKPKRQ